MYVSRIIHFQVNFTSKVAPSFPLSGFSSEESISRLLVATSGCSEFILAGCLVFLFICLHPCLSSKLYGAHSSRSCFIHCSPPSTVSLKQRASFSKAPGIACQHPLLPSGVWDPNIHLCRRTRAEMQEQNAFLLLVAHSSWCRCVCQEMSWAIYKVKQTPWVQLSRFYVYMFWLFWCEKWGKVIGKMELKSCPIPHMERACLSHRHLFSCQHDHTVL